MWYIILKWFHIIIKTFICGLSDHIKCIEYFLNNVSKLLYKKWGLSLWFHSSFHMLISVQYQVSLLHKPSGRLTSCISPDGLPYQPLTSMAPYFHDKPWNALLQCFYLGRMSQLMAWRLIIAPFIPQDWNQIWLPLGAKLFWSTEKLSKFQLCSPTSLLSSHLSIISLLTPSFLSMLGL